jgi:predicted nucleic acid-binding protein
MILMDVNTLVYTHREDTSEHDVYREWLGPLLMATLLLVVRRWC